MELEKTSFQEWITERADNVRDKITAFDVLLENGEDSVPDPSTAVQIGCKFHGPDRRPSARYYPATHNRHDSVRCFRCKETWDSINLHAKFRGIKFMDALAELEKRLGIKVPRRPEFKVPESPSERDSKYISEGWNDVEVQLRLLEKKLARVKDKCGFDDYIKLCRVLDVVSWDYDYLGESNQQMINVLMKARSMMDEIYAIPDSFFGVENEQVP